MIKKYGKHFSLLALALVSASAFADDMGSGSGWCAATNGAHIFTKDVTSTINYDSNDPTNSVKEIQWDSPGTYSARCDCSNTDYRGYNYFSADTGDLHVLGSHTDQRFSGYTMYYYELVPGKLEIGTETLIAGKLKAYIPVPFDNISNNDPSAGGCGNAIMDDMSAGDHGYVRIYIAAPLSGQIVIPSTKIMNLYLSKTGVGTPSPAVPHIAEFYISGVITIPQSCTINAGQTIEVKFPDLRASDIRLNGASPDASEQTTNVTFTCSNVADGSDVSVAITGENDEHVGDYLKTSNDDIGIKITDNEGNVVAPNGNARLPITDFGNRQGSIKFKSRPVNTTGDAPEAGTYEATATLTIKLQ
ncbi:fimbrial protein [Pseudocitrobacter cyperus]|uniref:Fimbrial protein n=1 Tax=Pseudocitrobacter cyperus TaxID=3112843 RepID=A0ABV0HHP4_9ENTR